jgi:hypothetical protein
VIGAKCPPQQNFNLEKKTDTYGTNIFSTVPRSGHREPGTNNWGLSNFFLQEVMRVVMKRGEELVGQGREEQMGGGERTAEEKIR